MLAVGWTLELVGWWRVVAVARELEQSLAWADVAYVPALAVAGALIASILASRIVTGALSAAAALVLTGVAIVDATGGSPGVAVMRASLAAGAWALTAFAVAR